MSSPLDKDHIIGNMLDKIDTLERQVADLERNPVKKFGGATNYAEFGDDGTLTLVETARVTQELWIDAGGIKAPGAKPATAIAHGTLETPAWQFANQAVAGNQETVSFLLRVPSQMDITEVPEMCIGWSTTTVDPGDDSEVAYWQLDYLWTALDEDTTAAGQEQLTVESVASTVAEGMVIAYFSGIDLPGASDVCMHAQLKRLSASATDTIADTLELHGVNFEFTVDKLGGDT